MFYFTFSQGDGCDYSTRAVTFGDTAVNEKGEEIPLEVTLTHETAQKTKQSLDYLVEIVSTKREAVERRVIFFIIFLQDIIMIC